MNKIILIVHNIRSTYNIGSILRTADGFGVQKVFFTGYSPYPKTLNDARLPHIADKLDKQIHKTALGAEKTIDWEYADNPIVVIEKLKKRNMLIVGLEQNEKSRKINEVKYSQDVAILIGEEVNGIEDRLLKMLDEIIEIPMNGQKESFNVSVATGIALYALRF